MVFIVEMGRGEPYTPSYSAYSCGYKAWQGFLSIGKSFGWEPRGTIPNPFSAQGKDYMEFFEPNYDPEDWQYCKRFDDADARALAAALRRAATSIRDGNVTVLERRGPLLLKDDISVEQLQRINQPSSELLDEFARFLDGGGFAFAWDD